MICDEDFLSGDCKKEKHLAAPGGGAEQMESKHTILCNIILSNGKR